MEKSKPDRRLGGRRRHVVSRSAEWEASEVGASSARNVRPGRVALRFSEEDPKTPKVTRHRFWTVQCVGLGKV